MKLAFSLLCLFHLKQFICPPDVKGANFFKGFIPGNPTMAPPRTAAESQAPLDPHMHFKIILRSLFLK